MGEGLGVRAFLYAIILTMKHTFLARTLRKKQTPQEQKLWNIIRNRNFYGLKFKRQFPIGKYIVDFVCLDKKTIIEIDGGQHNSPDNIIKDNERSQYLLTHGYRVIRFWNNDIDNNIEGVYEQLIIEFGLDK